MNLLIRATGFIVGWADIRTRTKVRWRSVGLIEKNIENINK
jgi:hypothetical protein